MSMSWKGHRRPSGLRSLMGDKSHTSNHSASNSYGLANNNSEISTGTNKEGKTTDATALNSSYFSVPKLHTQPNCKRSSPFLGRNINSCNSYSHRYYRCPTELSMEELEMEKYYYSREGRGLSSHDNIYAGSGKSTGVSSCRAGHFKQSKTAGRGLKDAQVILHQDYCFQGGTDTETCFNDDVIVDKTECLHHCCQHNQVNYCAKSPLCNPCNQTYQTEGFRNDACRCCTGGHLPSSPQRQSLCGNEAEALHLQAATKCQPLREVSPQPPQPPHPQRLQQEQLGQRRLRPPSITVDSGEAGEAVETVFCPSGVYDDSPNDQREFVNPAFTQHDLKQGYIKEENESKDGEDCVWVKQTCSPPQINASQVMDSEPDSEICHTDQTRPHVTLGQNDAIPENAQNLRNDKIDNSQSKTAPESPLKRNIPNGLYADETQCNNDNSISRGSDSRRDTKTADTNKQNNDAQNACHEKISYESQEHHIRVHHRPRKHHHHRRRQHPNHEYRPNLDLEEDAVSEGGKSNIPTDVAGHADRIEEVNKPAVKLADEVDQHKRSSNNNNTEVANRNKKNSKDKANSNDRNSKKSHSRKNKVPKSKSVSIDKSLHLKLFQESVAASALARGEPRPIIYRSNSLVELTASQLQRVLMDGDRDEDGAEEGPDFTLEEMPFIGHSYSQCARLRHGEGNGGDVISPDGFYTRGKRFGRSRRSLTSKQEERLILRCGVSVEMRDGSEDDIADDYSPSSLTNGASPWDEAMGSGGVLDSDENRDSLSSARNSADRESGFHSQL